MPAVNRQRTLSGGAILHGQLVTEIVARGPCEERFPIYFGKFLPVSREFPIHDQLSARLPVHDEHAAAGFRVKRLENGIQGMVPGGLDRLGPLLMCRDHYHELV